MGIDDTRYSAVDAFSLTVHDHEAFLDKPFGAAGLREAVSLLLHGTLKKPE